MARENVSSCEQMDHESPIDLYKDLSDPSIPLPQAGELQWMGRDYLPLIASSPLNELVGELKTLFESYGSNSWRQIWSATSALVRTKILQALKFTLTPGELRSIIASGEVC